LVATIFDQLSRLSSSSGTAGAAMPALLKSRSKWPNTRIVSRNSPRTSSSTPTSHMTAWARDPIFSTSPATDSSSTSSRPARSGRRGSGTTLLACAEEGFTVVGVEREPSYFAIAVRRLGLDGFDCAARTEDLGELRPDDTVLGDGED
jgi:hypothetical protein